MMNARRAVRGFTLIELMVTVVVLGILTSISVSSYRRYMVRTNRTEATSALLQIQVAQEKFFLQNNRYAGTAELAAAPPAGLGFGSTVTRPGGYYTLAITPAAPTNAYQATAVPVTTLGQASDTDCQTFAVDQSGSKTSANGGGTDTSAKCWR